MGLRRTYELTCDDCGRVSGLSADSPRHARSAAKRDGWGRIAVGHDVFGAVRKDYCPKCLDKIVEAIL